MKNNKIDIGYLIRIFVCILAFLGAVAYFSFSCKNLVNNYYLFTTVPWLINFAVSSALFMLVLGVTVVLLRPFWIAMITYLLGAILFPVITGFSIAAWVTAAVFLVFLVMYLFFEINQLNNQIKFSTHPLGDKKILISTILAIMISVAFGLGYLQDSVKRNYIVPPEAKTYVAAQAVNLFKPMIDSQKAPEKQKKEALKQFEENTKKSVNDAENSMKPYQKYIPYVIGIFAFFCFQMILILLSLVVFILISPLFWFLKICHFTHTQTEKCEVQHLTLKTIS